ncbi:MAG: leucyl aminopeptidase [Planctomycetes bacterium]|nr:leucyl aminopeptidase [Planctomycetota bacterium]
MGSGKAVEFYIVQRAAAAGEDPVLALFLHEGEPLPAGGAAVDEACGGLLSRVIASGEFQGKARSTLLLHSAGKSGPRRVLLVGLGKRGALDVEGVRRAAGAAALAGQAAKAGEMSAVLPAPGGLRLEDLAAAFVEGSALALYRYLDHRTGEGAENPHPLVRVTLVAADPDARAALDRGVAFGRVLADAAVFARDVGNTPGNEGTPTFLAGKAREIASESGMKLTVLDRADMEREGMGGILGVARGTEEPPKFIVLEHNAGRADLPLYALVGKGVTFDSGGISLKPGADMHEMKFDKCGAVAVLATMRAVGRLKLPLRVAGICPATENLPSGKAYKPGDVVRTLGGRTVEILNTDAEGRMLLVDGITWAKRMQPRCIVDLATLTGACVVALGDAASGLFSTDDRLASSLESAGAAAGERLWRMPVYEEYTEQIKSDVADFKNTGGRNAGACTAAALLKAHAEGTPWAHLDIAGTAWGGKDRDYVRKGATGVGPRTLVRWLVAESAAPGK